MVFSLLQGRVDNIQTLCKLHVFVIIYVILTGNHIITPEQLKEFHQEIVGNTEECKTAEVSLHLYILKSSHVHPSSSVRLANKGHIHLVKSCISAATLPLQLLS